MKLLEKRELQLCLTLRAQRTRRPCTGVRRKVQKKSNLTLGDLTMNFSARYFLTPRLQLLSGLEEQAKASSMEVTKSKETQEGLVRAMKGVEDEVKELLQNSPALARAFAAV
jgi:hypothetical protein